MRIVDEMVINSKNILNGSKIGFISLCKKNISFISSDNGKYDPKNF